MIDRSSDAAEQCQQEGTKLLSPTTLNEKIRKSLEKVEVNWFWMNGFQDNEDRGIIKDIETRVRHKNKIMFYEKFTQKKLTVKDLKGAKIGINWFYHALSPGDILIKSPFKDPYNLQKINFFLMLIRIISMLLRQDLVIILANMHSHILLKNRAFAKRPQFV